MTPPSPRSARNRRRRTQAERREATRTALLDAALECLRVDGYARTTTRSIAKRAGVTPGALQHHFPSKADLLGELLDHVRAKWASEIFSQGTPKARSARKRQEQLLDRAWQLYRSSYFPAMLELGVAARTDPELRQRILGGHDEMTRWNKIGASVLYPEYADRPELLQLIETGQATMRGLALAGLTGETDPDQAWPTVRSHILTMNTAVLGNPSLLAPDK